MRDPIPIYLHLRRAKDLMDREYALFHTQRSGSSTQTKRSEFDTQKLGFEVNADATMDDFRWLTVSAPERPDHELILLVPGPPMMDEQSAAQVKELVAKGALGHGAFEADDCRETYDKLSARGVTFLSEPAERFYGIEASFRDNSGNWFSMTQRTEAHVA